MKAGRVQSRSWKPKLGAADSDEDGMSVKDKISCSQTNVKLYQATLERPPERKCEC